jgi:hypothetical protein
MVEYYGEVVHKNEWKTEMQLVVAISNTGELQSGRLFLSLLPRPAVVRSRIRSRSIRLVSKRSIESVVCVNRRYDLADRDQLAFQIVP